MTYAKTPLPKVVGFHLDDDTDRAARALAAAEDRTLSNYLRGIVRDEIARREQIRSLLEEHTAQHAEAIALTNDDGQADD